MQTTIQATARGYIKMPMPVKAIHYNVRVLLMTKYDSILGYAS